MADHLDFSLLPDELRHLAPLIARYAQSDDSERSKLLEEATDDELRELSHAPAAHWEAINSFLDQYAVTEPGSRQDVAPALDSFSQAALEARYLLERRSSQS